MLKRLLINEVKDQYIQENFIRMQDFIRLQQFLTADFKFFSFTVTGAVTNLRFPHNLGFQPLDLIQTSQIGAGAVTWNYDKFTKEFLDVTTTAAVAVRGFVGRYDPEVKI